MATDLYVEDAPSVPAGFDFDLIGESLAEILDQPADGATVVGIHGPWGSGKTTLMYAIRDALRARPGKPEPHIVEFNAWKYQTKEALWRALILRLVAELQKLDPTNAKLEEVESSLYRAFEVQEAGSLRINWRNAAIEIATVALELMQLGVMGRLLRRIFGKRTGKESEPVLGADDVQKIGGVLERETVTRHLEQIQSIEQFLEAFRQLVGDLEKSGRVVVLVDDLDRCLPESALEVFEAIKLFLDAPGCAFVVAVDREVIRNGLAVRYGAPQGIGSVADADEYIEKTIGISYDVPRLSPIDLDAMIDQVGIPLSLGADQRKLIRQGLGRNPRRVKRFLNLLKLQHDIASRAAKRGHEVPGPLCGEGDKIELELLLKTMLVGYRYPFLLRRGDDLGLLFQLENVVVDNRPQSNDDSEQALRKRDAAFEKYPPPAGALKNDRGFLSLMELNPSLNLKSNKSKVIEYASWFRRTGAEATATERAPGLAASGTDDDGD